MESTDLNNLIALIISTNGREGFDALSNFFVQNGTSLSLIEFQVTYKRTGDKGKSVALTRLESKLIDLVVNGDEVVKLASAEAMRELTRASTLSYVTPLFVFARHKLTGN